MRRRASRSLLVETSRSSSLSNILAGMVAVGPDADLVGRYMRTAGKDHRIGQVALS
jgi:hypothetical protein